MSLHVVLHVVMASKGLCRRVKSLKKKVLAQNLLIGMKSGQPMLTEKGLRELNMALSYMNWVSVVTLEHQNRRQWLEL